MRRSLVPIVAGLTLTACTASPPREFDLQPASTAETGVLSQAPAAVKHVDVRYPKRAADAEMTGEVQLAVEVAADGTVSAARVVSETPPGYDFGIAAIAAVRQWTFPTSSSGIYTVTVRFER